MHMPPVLYVVQQGHQLPQVDSHTKPVSGIMRLFMTEVFLVGCIASVKVDVKWFQSGNCIIEAAKMTMDFPRKSCRCTSSIKRRDSSTTAFHWRRTVSPWAMGTLSRAVRNRHELLPDFDIKITDEALKWLRSKKESEPNKPWLLHVSYPSSHPPFSVPKSLYEMYPHEAITLPPLFQKKIVHNTLLLLI